MLYSLARLLVGLVVGILFRVEITGLENVPEGGCLVVSNHLSWTDTVFIIYALPGKSRLWTMANESTVFNTRFKRWLLPRLAVFPIRRNRGMLDEAAVNRVYELLEAGERVLVFPEGAYGRDGQLRPLKDGIGHFALNSGKPLLPVLLSGTGRLRPFSKVTVDIGRPFIPQPPLLWELRRRVHAAVESVRTAFAGMTEHRQRRGRRARRLRFRWGRRSARETAEPGPVEGGQADVEGGQPGADQDRAQGHAAGRPE